MMTIGRDGNGFRVSIRELGLGHFSVKAKNLAELQRAVEHYYGEVPHHMDEGCPICRLIQEEEAL